MFSHHFTKGNNFRDFLFCFLGGQTQPKINVTFFFVSLEDKSNQKGCTYKGKNLLKSEQILSFMS